MAETSAVVCPDHPADGTHCWHTRWITYGVWRESVTSSDGVLCCWCGEKRPTAVSYQPPTPHGKHLPAPFPMSQAVAQGTVTIHAPTFGEGGIPVGSASGGRIPPNGKD